MLKILDRYILKQFLGTFFFIILLFSMLATVIDFAEKIEDFTGKNAPSLGEIVFDYYFNFIPFINGLLFPLYTLIAVIFFTSRLAANSEIIGMLGSGVNYYRLLVPYILGALIIATLHYLGNHYLFPISSTTRVKFENTYIWKNNFNGPTDNVHLFLDKNTEVYIQNFNKRDSTGRNFWMMKYDSTGIKRPYTLIAKNIKNIDSLNRWQLKDYRVHTVDGMKEKLYFGGTLDTTLNLKMSDIIRRDNHHQTMTTNELITFIAAENARGSNATLMYEVERYRRTADAFMNIILTIIGFSIASRKMRGGIGWHLVLGVGISGAFIFMTKFSTTFSTNGGLPPILGIWLPNIIFIFVAMIILLRGQK